MKPRVWIPLGLALSILITGCGRGSAPANMQRLETNAPAAAGLPAAPGPDEPIPFGERTLFGLYTETPTQETLEALATGKLSPDQRYRAAVTAQGAWVARVDAAWVWQVPLKAQTTPQTPEQSPQKSEDKSSETAEKGGQDDRKDEKDEKDEKENKDQKDQTDQKDRNGQAAPTRTQRPGPAMVEWEAPSTLFIRDSQGQWWAADPDRITVTRMSRAPAIQTQTQSPAQRSTDQGT